MLTGREKRSQEIEDELDKIIKGLRRNVPKWKKGLQNEMQKSLKK